MKSFNALFLTIALLSIFLNGCGGDKSNYKFDERTDIEGSIKPNGPIYDLKSGNIPLPNSLAFGLKDGTLDLPNPNGNSLIAALNELDGASTSNPMIAGFGMPLDPESLVVGESIRIFEVTKAGPAVTGVVRELTKAEIIVKVVGEKLDTLALIPFPPLKESSHYEVVLTNNIKDKSGAAVERSTAYSIVRSKGEPLKSPFAALEPVRQHINNLEAIAESQGVKANSIVMSWVFSTQSTTKVLKAVAAGATAGALVVSSTGTNTSNTPVAMNYPVAAYEGLAFSGKADVYTGTLEVPYYLDIPSASNGYLGPITGYWKGMNGQSLSGNNTSPEPTTKLTVPVIMTLPNSSTGKVKPDAGWPIVMYQHGITRTRADVLIYADSLAMAGFAMIAIDLPLHGVSELLNDGETSNPLHTAIEPTFNVDYINNETQAPGPDGSADPSGTHYINLQSLLTSRDNNRQGVSNLLVLRRSLNNLADIDSSKVSFIAHSLGGVVGVPYLGVEDKVTPSVLIATGASISTIIRDSATYGPTVKGAFLAGDATRTEADYAKFLQGAQWVLDPSDPINFALDAVATHPIYMTEIIGNKGIHLTDQTVPNSATEILAGLLRAAPASAASNSIAIGSPKIIRFIQGDHSSILDPTDDVPNGFGSYVNVFEEMHSQVSSFMTSSGTKVDISDFGIILP